MALCVHPRSYVKQRPTLLAQSFGSNMVLQHDAPCLWGFGQAGATVQLSLNGTDVHVDVDSHQAHDGHGTRALAPPRTVVSINGTWQACAWPGCRMATSTSRHTLYRFRSHTYAS